MAEDQDEAVDAAIEQERAKASDIRRRLESLEGEVKPPPVRIDHPADGGLI